MRQFWITVSALFAICSVVIAAQTGGKISIDKQSHDFGKVRYGDKVSHAFVVTNTGNEPLRITKVDVDCGCTKALKGDSEIAPKGKSEIIVEFDTEGERSGKKEKNVHVYSSDPTAPEHGVKLTLLAEVVREFQVDPPTFAKKLPKFEETVSVPIKITNASDTPRTVKAIKCTDPNVDAKLESEKLTLAPKTTIPLNVTLHLKPNPQEPLYKGKILLETDHPKEKEIDIRFLVQIVQPKEKN